MQVTGFAIAKVPKNIAKLTAAEAEAEGSTDFITNKNYNMEIYLKPIISSLIFSILGLIILVVAYFIVEKLTPENTWKEIVHNKNVAVAIVFGAFIIGISIIISGAIHG